MSVFVLMTHLGPGTLNDAEGHRATGKDWLKRVKQACPHVKWIAR